MVTGAGAGLGKAIALAFAREGASVAVNDIDAATGAAVAEEIRNLGGGSCFAKVNVAKESEVQAMVKNVVDEFGGLDVMVNNAGGEMVKPSSK